MNIFIEWHDWNFNINLATSADKDAFLTIKGCKIVGEGDSAFVCFPARKNEKTNKWWNHVSGSDAFQKTIIELANKTKPKAAPAAAPAKTGTIDDLDSDIPF